MDVSGTVSRVCVRTFLGCVKGASRMCMGEDVSMVCQALLNVFSACQDVCVRCCL